MKTILLAEDDPFIVDVYVNQFKEEGYKVDIARDGETALEKIKSNCPDLLVLDINLPKINGCEILKTLKNDPKTKNLKVIVLSNYGEKDVSEKYNFDISNFGVIKYFLKVKSSPEEVTSAIKEILK